MNRIIKFKMKFSISILLSVATLLCGSAKAGLADSEKDKLLSLHKSTRSQVGASNMKSISWDSGLASAAQVRIIIKKKKN